MAENEVPDLIIAEDYKIRPVKNKGYDHLWSSVLPVRVIGALEYYCLLHDIEFVLQGPEVKPMAAKMAGMTTWTKLKSTHSIDAYLHGVHFLKSRDLKK